MDTTPVRQALLIERQLTTMVEVSFDAIIGWNLRNGLITIFNPAAEQLYGYDAQEFLGKPVALFIDFVQKQAEYERAIERLTKGECIRSEATIAHRDGTKKHVETTACAIANEVGEFENVICMVRDITERYQMMEHLARLGSIVHTSRDATIAWSTDDHTILVVNPAAEKMIGLVANKIVGQSALEVARRLGKEDRFFEVVHRVEADGLYHLDGCVVRPDGTKLYLDATASYLVDSDGHHVGMMIVIRDMTEIRHVYEQLRESEERLRVSQQVAGIGTFDWNILTGINIWTPELEMMYGLAPGDFAKTQAAWENMVHPDDRVVALAKVEEALATGRSVEGEWRVVWSDGSVHWIAGRFQGFSDAAGARQRLIGVNFDITERKRAEEQLARLASIVQTSDDAIIGRDFEGHITSWNRGAQTIFGYTAEEAIGQPITIMVPPAYMEEAIQLIEDTKHGKPVVQFETIRQRKDGSLVDVALTVSRITNNSGQLLGASVIVRDISEKKLAEAREERLLQETMAREQAEETNRLKDNFLAMVSHELRTPLNAIVGWVYTALGMLGKPAVDMGKLHQALETIQRNAKNQTQLINDLLDISRIISGNLRLTLVATHVRSVIEASLTTLRPTADAKRITIQTHLEPSLMVLGDSERLQQIVVNLLANAVKFTPEGGVIKIQLVKKDAYIHLVIEDTGVGIHSDFLPFVFDRFRQAEGSLSRRYGGLGLGLTIVKGLVEYHKGEIHVESPGENQGSTFTVTLPLLASSAEEIIRQSSEVLPKPSLPSLQGMRILLVEDDTDTRVVIALFLEQQGAQVVNVSSASLGFFELEQQSVFHVIISDIEMPLEDGYSFLRRVRQKNITIPAIALTAHARAEDRIRALQVGFHAHIPKPVDFEELVTVIVIMVGRM